MQTLFTGILVRYLALAAQHQGLERDARDAAAGLVRATGDALWNGRDAQTGLFPTSSATAADSRTTEGTEVELSPQLQAWTVMEAAARLG